MNTKSSQIEKTIPDKPGHDARAHLPAIVYADDRIIAFNKPAGLLVAPDRWNKARGCLAELVHQCVSPEAFNLHRIDADTSGIVLFAKTRETLRAMARLFEERLIKKRYLAIACGAPPRADMTIKLKMRQDNFKPGTMMVAKGGMQTETRIRLKKRWKRHCLLEVLPVTGKTHQIRLHLASIGCPIVADNVYGNGGGLMLSSLKRDYRFSRDRAEKPLIGRLALHAAEISFQHPFTGQKLKIAAPWPKDFLIAVKYLDKFA